MKRTRSRGLALVVLLGAAATADCKGGSASLLTGQVEFKGQPPALTAVTYTTKAGDTVTQDMAFQGWVTLLVDPGATSQVSAAVAANGGKVVDAIPLMGLYTVQVASGQEAAFLSALFVNPAVLDGEPATADVNACVSAIDSFTAGQTTACSVPHGKEVEAVLSRDGQCVTEIDKGPLVVQGLERVGTYVTDGILRPQSVRLMINEAEAGFAAGRRVVINISEQSGESFSGDKNKAWMTCPSMPTAQLCKSVQQGQKEFVEAILSVLAEESADVRNNTLVVVAAGNAGVDLSQALGALAFDPRYQEAFNHVQVVGSTATGGAMWERDNYSDNGTMVYALGQDVVTVSGCKDSGTSFAAPEVARVMSMMWDAAPSLTSDEIVDSLAAALSGACGGAQGDNGILPQSGGATDPAFIACAVGFAKALTPGGGSASSSGTGGGGDGQTGTCDGESPTNACGACSCTADGTCNGPSSQCGGSVCWWAGPGSTVGNAPFC